MLNFLEIKTSTLQAWEIVKAGQPFENVKDLPGNGQTHTLPSRRAPPPAVLKGFDVVNQMVQWRVELKDPSQLATLSQQGITRDALRELTQSIPKPTASLG